MAILLVILMAASFYYYAIFDHMTNIEILNKITRKKLLSCSNFFLQSWVYNKRISANSTAKIRSSHRKCSGKKCVLRNFAKFTGKDLCQSLFCDKVATLLNKILWHRSFPVNFANFLRTPFLQNAFRRLLLSVFGEVTG